MINELKMFRWLAVVSCLASAAVQAQPVVVAPLHAFTGSPDGAEPVSLVLGQTDGALYGITFAGGASNYGSIYRINRDGSNYRLLRSFSSAETGDSLGAFGYAAIGLSLCQGNDGALYGTTEYGGTNGDGTVFKMSTDGNFFTVLHTFQAADAAPLTLMQGSDGVLYGSGVSTVFALDTDGGNYRVLHTLVSGSEGTASYGKLLQGSDGTLYGTALLGGTNSGGTVFKLDTNGNFSVLHTFTNSPDGQLPFAGLIEGADGALYGTTESGGTNTKGTIFKLGTNGDNYQVLYNFGTGTNDGAKPYGALVQGLGGTLYGTTEVGGTNGTGTAFKIGLDGSGYNVLFNFIYGGTGDKPCAALISGASSDGSGVLYGTTIEKSANNLGSGAVFAMLVNPPLSITPVGNQTGSNQTVLFWPQWAFNYTLQTTTNLASTNWITVSNAVPVTGVQLTNGLPGAFYRLIYQ